MGGLSRRIQSRPETVVCRGVLRRRESATCQCCEVAGTGDARVPLASVEANNRLIEALDAAGLSTRISQPKPLVSDLLRAKAGAHWVDQNLAFMRGKPVGEFVPMIDGLAINRILPRSSVLHASVWAYFPSGDSWTNTVQSSRAVRVPVAVRASEARVASAA